MKIEIISQFPETQTKETPILFVHGFWQGAWCWAEKFMPFFAKQGYECHALDLRGHGRSPGKNKLRWTPLSAYVDDLAQVISEMEKTPILIGHSMGGMIVQKYLENHTVPAAILLASAPPRGLIPATFRVIGKHPWPVLKANLTLDMYHVVATPNLYRDAYFSNQLPDEELVEYHGKVQTDSYRAYMDMMFLNLPKTGKINGVPMLVLGSPDDLLISQKDVERAAKTYNADMKLFPGMGHNMMLDVGWENVVQEIADWLDAKGFSK